MSAALTREETALLALLRAALTDAGAPPEADDPDLDYASLCAIAQRHAVLPLIAPLLDGHAPEAAFRPAAERCAAQFYRLLILSRRYAELLDAGGAGALVLKGAGAAWYYPVPEMRKSGDIDLLLLRPETLPTACAILARDGAAEESGQHANHHRAYRTPEGITLEVHSAIAEDFDDPRFNALCGEVHAEMAAHTLRREILPGCAIPVPDEPMQAICLLLHMLQHFLRAGFGLKLLCDWAAFWNALPAGTDMGRYERFLDDGGVRGFADMVGSVCVRHLGLDPEKLTRRADFDEALCREFLREVLDAEEFGKSGAERMVMVRGGAAGYLREFHHQMLLGFPRASRCALLWPVLWCAALVRFLRNNRTVRGVTLGAVLRETRRRSRLTEPLHLFRR